MLITGSSSKAGGAVQASDAVNTEAIDLFFVDGREGPSEIGGRRADVFARTSSRLPFEPNWSPMLFRN
jgi:hypothetical protein